MAARVELILDGHLDQLRIAWQVGETLLNEVPFEDDPKVTRYNILVAMQELLTNVFRHGYLASSGQVVEVTAASGTHTNRRLYDAQPRPANRPPGLFRLQREAA